MKRFLFLLISVAIAAPALFGQQANPTPPKDDDQTIKISTNLIQVDVTVTDKNGKLITDLTEADFELYEDGERQNISNFSMISKSTGGATAGTAGGENAIITGGTTGGASIAPKNVRRTIAIVVDDLSLSHASIYYTRKALVKFVDEQMQPGDLVAIIRTGGGVGTLQQFTSDKRLLHMAIDKIRWNPFGGSIDALSPVSQNNSDISERFRSESDMIASGSPKTFVGVLTRESVADTKTMDYKASKNTADAEKGTYTLTALGVIKYIISGMGKLPGRKSMMLFSDGISLGGDSGKVKGTHAFDYMQDVADTRKPVVGGSLHLRHAGLAVHVDYRVGQHVRSDRRPSRYKRSRTHEGF